MSHSNTSNNYISSLSFLYLLFYTHDCDCFILIFLLRFLFLLLQQQLSLLLFLKLLLGFSKFIACFFFQCQLLKSDPLLFSFSLYLLLLSFLYLKLLHCFSFERNMSVYFLLTPDLFFFHLYPKLFFIFCLLLCFHLLFLSFLLFPDGSFLFRQHAETYSSVV